MRVLVADNCGHLVLSNTSGGPVLECQLIPFPLVESTAAWIRQQRPDAVLLAVDEKGSAIAFLRGLRATQVGCACVLLGAQLCRRTIAEFFRAGGDDFLLAPFSAESLCARLLVLHLRREAVPQRSAELVVGPLRLDPHHRVFLNGVEHALRKKELTLLHYLCHHVGRVVTHEELRWLAWEADRPLGSNSLEVHLSRLRRWLRSALPDGSLEIHSIRHVGYRLHAGASRATHGESIA